MNHPVFEIVTTTAGALSIRNKVIGEIMHNPVGPWIEANALYVDQPKLRENLKNGSEDELVVYDVGLGAAANALAAIHCVKNLAAAGENPRHLKIVSFEKNLELLEFALIHANEFHHFQGFENAIRTLLDTGSYSEEYFSWILHHGDFLDLIEKDTHKPHIIFYDPYSPQVNKEMWTTHCFKKLFQKCRNEKEGGTTLYTYSQSTPIRVALFVAGFYVGAGSATGLKAETTEAASVLSLLDSPLAERWFIRWKKSGTPYPFDCNTAEEIAETSRLITEHSQFANKSVTQ